ncbi:MAG: DUF456 domain-containing protein [Akkermansia sp.]|nr:DUF456 domain-containing protein [Akkermansia sp.]
MLTEFWNWLAGVDYGSGALYAAAVLLYIAGFMGAVLPYPGCMVALGGSVCYALATGEPYPAWWFWGILLALAIFGTLADNITTALGARKFGGSKQAFWGSMIGLVVGAFFIFPFGIIIGPFLGAFIAEYKYQSKTARDSAKSGLGATLGLLAGVLAKLIIMGLMLVLTVM